MKSKLLLLLCVLFLTSCSSDLIHTWNIDTFQVIKENGQKTESNNIGTITFNKNGSGNKDISYSIYDQNYTDKAPFKWEKHEGYILLKPAQNTSTSKLDKAWIIVQSDAKKQVWKSTEGQTVLTLQLSRN